MYTRTHQNRLIAQQLVNIHNCGKTGAHSNTALPEPTIQYRPILFSRLSKLPFSYQLQQHLFPYDRPSHSPQVLAFARRSLAVS